MNASSHLLCAALFVVAFASRADSQAPPAELASLMANARLDHPVSGWCRGEFRSGRAGGFAVALQPAADSGRYLVIEADATMTELAAYEGTADLACYTRAEAESLNTSIRESETVSGDITPRFDTTVVCAFVRDTEAVCWQYSAADGAFVRVGGWIT